MRLRLLSSHSFRHSRFTLANRITSLLPTTRQAKFVEMRAPVLCHTLGCLKFSQAVETQSGGRCTSKITALFLIDFPGLVQLDHRLCSGCTQGARWWVKSLK
jgi:hypothetical protein